MISDRISNDIPPQIKILNVVVPILMHFCNLVSNCKPHIAARHPMKCDIINDIKLFPKVYRRIYCHKFLMLPNQTSRYKSKCIRMKVIVPNVEGGKHCLQKTRLSACMLHF